MEIRTDFKQHVNLRVRARRDGRVSQQLLIGTADEIADAVGSSLRQALRYGETAEITLTPIPPYEVVELPR